MVGYAFVGGDISQSLSKGVRKGLSAPWFDKLTVTTLKIFRPSKRLA